MITVTAERYVSNVQQTPIAITVLSGGGLQRQGITDLQSAISTVPALHVQASPQGAQLYIRGVGTNGDSNWVDPDVALMFDGLYSGRAEAALSSLYDVNRIEVLKGPQGTLYGRNAVGGVINIDTNDPVIGRYEAGAGLGTGNYRLMHADGYLNLPVSDTLAIRLAAERETHSGYYSNGGGAEHMVSTRLKALWEPSDDWSCSAPSTTGTSKASRRPRFRPATRPGPPRPMRRMTLTDPTIPGTWGRWLLGRRARQPSHSCCPMTTITSS